MPDELWMGVLHIVQETRIKTIPKKKKCKKAKWLSEEALQITVKRRESEVKVIQSCPTVRPVDFSPPSSSIHGILQARILEWVAISFSREKKRREKQRRKGKIQASECRIPKNRKEKKESLLQRSMQRNRGKQQNGKD